MAKPKAGEPTSSSVVHASHQIKDLLVLEARKKGNMFYQGHCIRVVEDYCPDVIRQRIEYNEVMAELYQQGLRSALLYTSLPVYHPSQL